MEVEAKAAECPPWGDGGWAPTARSMKHKV